MDYLGFVVLQSLWLSLPAYIANTVPVLVQRMPILNTPVDFGMQFGGKPLFGAHKTYRGFFFGIVSAILVVYLQTWLFMSDAWAQEVSLFSYREFSPVLVGLLLGGGALTGDLVKSFFKRRVGVTSGTSWFPFDQIDYMIGALLFLSIIYVPSALHMLVMIVVGLVLTLLSSYVGFFLGMKESKI